MSILAAGPWVGEFGWELFGWQAYLRALATNYDSVIVASRPGHTLLYRDFAKLFIPCPVDIGDCSGSRSFTDVVDPFEQQPYTDRITPEDAIVDIQQFIPFGRNTREYPIDYVIHARAVVVSDRGGADRARKKEARNWPVEQWTALLAVLEPDARVCSIGARDSAHHVPNTIDLRGIDLASLANVLRSARLIIGPSSGPMHFATLCNCPQFVWGRSKNRVRYEQDWNPFRTIVRFVCDDHWDIKADALLPEFRDFVATL